MYVRYGFQYLIMTKPKLTVHVLKLRHPLMSEVNRAPYCRYIFKPVSGPVALSSMGWTTRRSSGVILGCWVS
jgi:hypothetical protein